MRRLVVVLLAAAGLLAGCGDAASGGSPGSTSPAASVSTTRPPVPAGRTPSLISRMVCSRESQSKIARVLGVRAEVPKATWVNHVYSCRFIYPHGHMVVSVKELSSWSQTFAYYRGLGSRLGRVDSLGNLGQGAYVTRNGSVVVRKDWKVLLVDVADLPPKIGSPPTAPPGVAYSVAALILGCWAGD